MRQIREYREQLSTPSIKALFCLVGFVLLDSHPVILGLTRNSALLILTLQALRGPYGVPGIKIRAALYSISSVLLYYSFLLSIESKS